MSENDNKQEEPKLKKLVEGADNLSLGISIVVAILIGVAIGIALRDTFNQEWLLWLGVFWGVAAAVMNVYKAYKKQVQEYDEFKDDVRYSNYKKDEDDAK